MLDFKKMRETPDLFRQGLAKKGADPGLVEQILALDQDRRGCQTEADQLKAEKKEISKSIGQLKKAGQDASEVMGQVKILSEKIADLDRGRENADEAMQVLLLDCPNIPHESAPEGKSEADNREESRWGEPPTFDFAPRAHDDLGQALGILDFERAAKISGSRFVFLKGLGAKLERALTTLMLDVHTNEHGYTELAPPYLVKAPALVGTGNLPKFEDDLFKVPDHHYLIPTAEVPVTNYHREEILDGADLPIAYCAYTPCFRSEAGSYGKDVKGMIRQHQFDKVELVRFCTPEQGLDQLEILTRNAEIILEKLELPYRRMTLCTGDMSFASHKTYDLEVWLPSQNCYREISSCSLFADFQARRASIRYRKDGNVQHVHTVNGSGLAVGRTLVAILENYQQADGSVIIPSGLVPYVGVARIEPGPS